MTIRPRQPKEPPPEEKKAPSPDPEPQALAAASQRVRDALDALNARVKEAELFGLQIEWGVDENNEMPTISRIEYVKEY